ncbi:MAG: hypothetical protein QME90_01140 [Thermodesulfobacteriota bacterium]|nr:hypothetical protein [Thermodesulfobacteriota bacterium]
MTHSLHREGTLDSLERDYAVFIYPARGFNYPGSGPKVRRLMELLYLGGPSNVIVTTLRRNLYSGVSPDEILNSIKDGARVFSAFNSREKIKEVLQHFKQADEGISIVVSGLIDRVREISDEIGLNPHMVNLSLGIHGNTDRLPPADIRQFTTMCGHGVVSPNLVCDVLRKLKRGKVSVWEGSLILASPCACGIYNPHRSEELLQEMAPLYTVDRW